MALARTASFFSNDQAPLSSRTVRFISGIHFPPGIMYTSNAPLYGIENTNRGCPFHADYIPGQDFPPARSIDGVQPGLGILTGKANLNDSDAGAVNPGGVPLFKQGVMVGGVGVAGVHRRGGRIRRVFWMRWERASAPIPRRPGVVIINGIALPFVNQTTHACRLRAGIGRWQLTRLVRWAARRRRRKAIWWLRAPDRSADSRKLRCRESSTRPWRRPISRAL